MQLEKQNLHRNETTTNSPVITNDPSQNISDSSTQKQSRTQINNVLKLTNDNLKEPQPEETSPEKSSGGDD